MDSLIALVLLACLLTFVGAVLGIVAFARIGTLRAEVRDLRDHVTQLKRPPQVDGGVEAEGAEDADAPNEDRPDRRHDPLPQSSLPQSPSPQPPTPNQAPTTTESVSREASTKASTSDRTDDAAPATSGTTPAPPPPPPPSPPSAFVLDPWPLMRALQRNWMAWLGGLSIALAGIFLARYAIEQGLLGPVARVALGLATGVALHAAAAWLRKNSGSHPSLAAMAGGGSITLFATLLAALHYYQMFSPTLVFVVLALVALATMWLAVAHGPLLAIIGMLGAYAVPVLVSTGSGNVLAALIYALIISASVLLLARVVRIGWLWWGAVIGALGWWLLSLDSSQVDGMRGLYLAALAYLLLAICPDNWRLLKTQPGGVWLPSRLAGGAKDDADSQTHENENENETDDEARPPIWERGVPAVLLGIVLAQFVSMLHSGWLEYWPAFFALPALLLFVGLRQPRLLAVVWTLLLGTWLCIVSLYTTLPNLDLGRINEPVVTYGALFLSLASLALLHLLAALWGVRHGGHRAWWASLLAMTPVLSCLCAYLAASAATRPLYWTLLFAGVAAVQMAIAVIATNRAANRSADREGPRWIGIWHFIAGHSGYALAVSVFFEAATLTLALAAQVLSLAWLIRRFDVPAIGWLLKLVVAVVVVRLTINPWLADYPDLWHWPLWTYGGATLLCWASSRQLVAYSRLRQWTEIATLHLFVLTVWAEARYLLHDGQILFAGYSFAEATLNIGLAGALSLVYHQRARISGRLASWYRGYSLALLALALLNYGGIVRSLMDSDRWAVDAIGPEPVFNLLTLALGLPIVLGLLFARFYRSEAQSARKLAALFVGIAGFVFVSFQIRHLWQGTVSLRTSTSAGELYTYSVVWLLMAVGAMLLAGMRQWPSLYRGGLALLAVVIVKIFLIDLSDLDGLLRVASFMGLGLALVGISFLHQRIKPGATTRSS